MDEQNYTFAQGVADAKNSILSLIGARNEVRHALADGKPAGSDNAPTPPGPKSLNPVWIIGGALAVVVLLKVARQ